MKMKIILLILAYFFMTNYNFKLFAQDFIVTDLNVMNYFIDPFTKEVYFQPISPFILKANIYTQKTDTTFFSNLPVFANKKHLSGYSFENKIYFYDFDSDYNYLFLDSTLSWINLSFSPNDSAVIFNATYHDINNYRIQKISNYPRLSYENIFDEDGKYIWSSDSTLIRSGNNHSILNYYIKSGISDTLVAEQTDSVYDYYPVPHFAYNDSLDAVAYTRFSSTGTSLRLCNIETKEDLLLYEDSQEIDFRSLRWSPNNKKLAFVPIGLIGSHSGLHIFDMDKNETLEIISFFNVGFGLKDNIQWLNNDTLLYLDRKILGIKADTSANITIVNNTTILPTEFSLSQNYPNPFNPITTISYAIPVFQNVELKVYDILGKEVATLVNKEQQSGIYEVQFNSKELASGIYFYQIRVGSFVESKKMILLK